MHGKNRDLIHSFKNPELFLQYVRVKTLLHILEQYQTNLTNYDAGDYTCHPLLSFNNGINRFLNYFSINYDPILYQELLNSGIFKKGSMEDGFEEKNGKGNGLYFQYNEHLHFFNLHGAYSIYSERNNGDLPFKHKQLRADTGNNINQVCMKEFKAYSEEFDEYLKKPGKGNYPSKAPLVIMEDRHDIKKKLLEDNDYLKIGYGKLKESQKIFTFGCSFTYDEHLLDALLSCNGTRKAIALGHYGDEEKERFKGHIKKYKAREHHHVCLIETKGHEKLVWQPSRYRLKKRF